MIASIVEFKYSNSINTSYSGQMQVERLRNALSVVVLGMLSEETLHPYAMRLRIEERAYDRLPGIKLSSLYDVVRRLADAGLIQADQPHRSGRRPERTPFTITPAGRDELRDWVDRTLADDSDPDALPSALSFMYSLGRDRVLDTLRAREKRMTEALEAATTELAHSAPDNPIFISEYQYQLARRRAERDWLTGFLRALDNGDLVWPH
jgi:DNA-binding PadR family transcriptional regulator